MQRLQGGRSFDKWTVLYAFRCLFRSQFLCQSSTRFSRCPAPMGTRSTRNMDVVAAAQAWTFGAAIGLFVINDTPTFQRYFCLQLSKKARPSIVRYCLIDSKTAGTSVIYSRHCVSWRSVTKGRLLPHRQSAEGPRQHSVQRLIHTALEALLDSEVRRCHSHLLDRRPPPLEGSAGFHG